MPTPPNVLLLSHSGDFFTIDRVADALRRRGARPIRFNTDLFPSEIQLSSRLGPGGVLDTLHAGELRIATNEVRAVWLRRIWASKFDSDLDETFRADCAAESSAALHGFLDGLHHCRWIDTYDRVQAAENKQRQLRLALDAGLTVPPTVMTNNPEHVLEFFSEMEGNVVAKLLRPLSYSMSAPERFVYTSSVSAEDIESLDGLRYSPMVFQARIPAAAELRVSYVDGQCFVGEIRRADDTQPDWRRDQVGTGGWNRATLPEAEVAAVGRLMARLGLVYGAVDFIRTPSGQHYFLEVNPCGEWGMLEKELDLPISEALADALLAKEAK